MKVFLEMTFFKEKHLDYLKEKIKQVTWVTQKKDAYDAQIIIVTPDFVKKRHLEPFKQLKWIQLLTSGYNQVDMAYVKKRNIVLSNAKDVFSIQIAEDVVSKILAFNRQLKGQFKHMEQGVWKHIPITSEVYGSTIGIVGTGSIGVEVAKRLKAFETTVLGYRKTDEKVKYFDKIYTSDEGLDEMLKISDYIVLAIPLEKQTYHLIHRDRLKLFKKTAVIINVARGEIIDQEALEDALIQNQIKGALLDVTTPEPLPLEHRLWTLPSVIITPHNASASPVMTQRLLDMVSENVLLYLSKHSVKHIVKF